MTYHFNQLKENLEKYESIKKAIQIKEEEMDTIIYELENVKGIKYEKVMSGGSSNNNEQKRLGLIDKKSLLSWEITSLQSKLRMVNCFVWSIKDPVKSLIQDRYFEKKKLNELELKYGWSSTTIWRKINREIENFIIYNNETKTKKNVI